MDFQERAVLGLPIDTPFGKLKPLSIYDFLERGDALSAITFDKPRVLHEIRLNQPEEQRNTKEMTALLREMNEQYSLKDILITYMEPYFHAYVEVISRCSELKEDETFESKQEEVFEYLKELDAEEFDAFRQIILEINNQATQTASLDPTVQAWKEKALRYKSTAKGDGTAPNLSTMVTSIVSFSGHTFSEILEWNIAQLQQVFQRIGLFKAYDTTTLFSTVTDKIDIQDWSKNIEIENDSNTSSNVAMSYKAFQQNMGDAVNSAPDNN